MQRCSGVVVTEEMHREECAASINNQMKGKRREGISGRFGKEKEGKSLMQS